jgi:hypothetical protein
MRVSAGRYGLDVAEAWAAVGPLVGVVIGAVLAALFQRSRDRDQAARELAKEHRATSRDAVLTAVRQAHNFVAALNARVIAEMMAEGVEPLDPRFPEAIDATHSAVREADHSADVLAATAQEVRVGVSVELADALEHLCRVANGPFDPQIVDTVVARYPRRSGLTHDAMTAHVIAKHHMGSIESIARRLLGVEAQEPVGLS